MNRRTFLKGLGVTAGLTAGAAGIVHTPNSDGGTPSPSDADPPPGVGTLAESPDGSPPARPGEPPPGTPGADITRLPEELGPFERRIDATRSLGVDPDGNRPINDQLSGLSPGTLVEFPTGTYRLDGPITIETDRIGFLGTGDATLRPPANNREAFLTCDGPDGFLFVGIDVDMRGNRSGHMRVHCPSAFYVADVRYRGRGANTGYAFNVAVGEPSGAGTLQNVRVPRGSRIDGYNAGDGRIGVWAGNRHRGTLAVVASRFCEFGNNGMYTSRCPGDVQVVDSYFENNSPSSIRISGDGSYARNCTIRFDLGAYTGPEITDVYNARGIVIEQKSVQNVPFKPAGALVERCLLEYLDTGSVEPNSQAIIHQWGPSHTLTVRNSWVRTNADGVPVVWREPPRSRSPHRPTTDVIPKPHWLRLENLTVTGSAGGETTIDIDGADGCVVRNCRITQTGPSRDGITVEDATNTRVVDSRVAVTGFPIVSRNATIQSRNNRSCRACLTPQPPAVGVPASVRACWSSG